MSTRRVNLISRIREEAARERSVDVDEILTRVRNGDVVRATGNLIFHTEPAAFEQKLAKTLNGLERESTRSTLEFLVKLAIDLSSFLPEWNLSLNPAQIKASCDRVTDLLGIVEQKASGNAREVHAKLRREVLARLAAEAVDRKAEREEEADTLLGTSLVDYTRNMTDSINRSNFQRVARARKSGKTMTEIGNDYAVFLEHVLRLGASFVTTNPVLVKLAWDSDPEFWNSRADRLILHRYSKDDIQQILTGTEGQRNDAVTAICSDVTMAVVVENCRLLRDIFLITEGQEGYVSLQVNPTMHDNPVHMVSEARSLYSEMEKALGGVPNVVFKLPSTAAGLHAAEILTTEGIGVTITLTFSVFQAHDFAKVLSRGNQLVSYIAIMNGRMAFPVRDELKDAGVPKGVEAARWAGVEVARKAACLLYSPIDQGGLGVDRNRIKILIASLRIYDGWIPDISELWGIPLITVFPNVRRAYEAHERALENQSVEKATPQEAVKILQQSEIFRQAWWMPGDDITARPKRRITLQKDDQAALASWPPIADTLNQFIDLYEQMGQIVIGRMRSLSSNC